MIDVLNIAEVEQTEIDPVTGATTVHTGLNLPDGGEGFLILGRIVRSRNKVMAPLKEVIKSIIIEYQPEYEKSEDTAPAEEDIVPSEQDRGGEAGDGEQAVSGKPRSHSTGRKGR